MKTETQSTVNPRALGHENPFFNKKQETYKYTKKNQQLVVSSEEI